MLSRGIRAIRSFVFDQWHNRNVSTRQTIFITLIALVLLLPYTAPGGANTQFAIAPTFQVDEGTILYDSLRVAHGQVPYRDFFEFPGPVTFLLYGSLFRFVGPSFEAARWMSIIIMALGAGLVAAVATRLAGRIAGLAAALIHTCAFVPSFPYAYTHWIAEAAGLTGLLFIGREKPGRRDDFIGGVFCGIALLTVQSVGLPLLVAAIGTVWLRGAANRNVYQAIRRPIFVLLGGASIFGAAVLYFAAVGGLQQFLYCTWIWPLGRYALAQRGGMQYGYAFDQGIAAHAKIAEPLRAAAIATLKLIVTAPTLAIAGALIASIWALRALLRRQPLQMSRVIVAGMCLAAIFPPLSGRTRADVTHIAFISSFGILGACAFLSFFRRRSIVHYVGTAALLLTSVTCTYAYAAKTRAVSGSSAKKVSFREQFDRETMQTGILRPLRNEIHPHLRPDEPIVEGLMSGYYHFFFHPTDLRTTRISNIKESEYYTEEQIRQNVATIVRNEPKVIAFWTDYQFNTLTSRAPGIAKLYHPYTRNIWVLKSWAKSEGLLKPQ